MTDVVRILYADSSRRDRELLRQFVGVADDGFRVTEVRSLAELCESVQVRDYGLVLGDPDLSGCLGLELIDAVKARRPDLPIVILTADKDRALEAVKLGVVDCLDKTPRQLARLPQVIRTALERTRRQVEKVQVEERLRMLTRARKVMAECNRVQARATEEGQLLRDMCRIVVESGGYGTAWIGMVRHDEERTIEPVASAGALIGHLSSSRISWGDNESGQGPAGMAVRSRKPETRRHLRADPYFSTRLKDVIAGGSNSAAALPLVCDGDTIGVLGILAAEAEAFDPDELALLEELAHDIAYSLSNLRLRAMQHRAEHLLRLEHTVTRCLAEADSAAAAMNAIMRAVCETQGWDCGRYFRVDETAGVLAFDGAWGVPGPAMETFIERSRSVTYAPGAGLLGYVWQTGEPLWIADILDDARARRAAYTAETGIRGAFLFPVQSGALTIGVIAFSSREIREPDERLLQAARVIGSQIGQFLQRKQAEAVLRESEARFRSRSELSSDWYWETDRDHRYTVREGKGLFDQKSVLGKKREELPGFVCGAAEWEAHQRALAERRPFRDLVYQRRAADGTLSYVSISGEPVFDARGEFQGYRGTGKEVTASKRVDQLTALEHMVTRCLADSETVEGALQGVMRAICETEAWECGRYFRADDAADALRFVDSWHVTETAFEEFAERSRHLAYQRGVGLVGRVWQSGEPLWSVDLQSDSRARTRSFSLDIGIRAAFVFPVTAEGRTIGVLSFSSREARAPDERLLRAVHAIGSQIGQFLRRIEGQQELQRFRAAMDTSSDMIVLVDRATMRYVDVNATACEMQGYTREEMLRMGPQDVAGTSREELERVYDEIIAGGRTTWHKSVHRRKDGTSFPIESFRRAVRLDRGWIIVAIMRDVSERARAEQLQNLEHAVAHCLAESEGASAALTGVMRAICESERWDAARYFRADEEAGVLRFSDSWSIPDAGIERFLEASRSVVFPRGVGLSGQAWESGQPLWSTDLNSDPRAWLPVPTAKYGIRGTFIMPITAEGRTLGVLNFSSRQPREPDEGLLRAVHVIGSQVGQFVQRKQAEAVLRESEGRFRSLTVLSSDMYWEQDADYRFTELSGTGSGWLDPGRRRHVIGKRRWDSHYLNMTPAAWAAHIADLDARRPFHDLELCRLNDSGQQIWISVSGEPRFDASGAFTGYRGVGKDVTARKREQHLLALEHAINRVIAGADSVIGALQAAMRTLCESEGWECGRSFLLNESGTLRFATAWHVPEPAFEDFVERSRRSEFQPGTGLVGRVWQSGEPLWSADLISDDRALKRSYSVETGVRAAFNFPIIAEGRTIGVLAFSSREIRKPDERLLRSVHTIGTQIGQFLQRMRAEEVLRESEARFRSLTTLSSDWYWEQDEEYRFVDMTSEIDRRTGVSALAHIGKRRWELAAPNMTDADWAAHRAVVEAHQPFQDLELCRSAEDGSLHWVSISGEPIFDGGGRFKGYRGIGKDITARKREERLLALEHAVTRRLAEADTAGAGLAAVMRAMCESEGWECGRYLQVDEGAGVLRFSEHWCRSDPEIERFIAGKRETVYGPGVGLAGRVWQSGAPLWSADTTTDERGMQSAVNASTGMRGAFVFPVTVEGRTIGVLTFNSRQGRDPDERMLRAVHAIGSQIGQFLQRKEADEKIANQALQQRLIAEFGQQALGSAEVADVLSRAADLVSSTLKADYCSVLELVPERQQLIYRAVTGWPAEWIGQREIPAGPRSRLAHVLETREPLVTEDYGGEEGYTPSLAEKYGIRSAAQVPVFGPRGAFGVLSAYTLQRRRFTDEEMSFMRSVANILAIAIERKNAEDKLSHLAQFDTITALPNRHLLRDRLAQAVSQAQRSGSVGSVLFVDLDRFKAVNDTFGHSVGDKLLREVAARLKSCVRGGDTVARLSGDEFAVVLTTVAKADDAGLVAQKIVTALAAPFTLDGHQTYISASVGVALYPADGADPDALLKNADTAMYRAKEQGRNCYQFYLPQMNDRLMERLQVEARLRGALDRREFVLHYQPKVQLDTGVISGFEALLRWRQDGKLVSPAEFIPILEDTGLIVPVGEWVLRSVCEQLKQWQDRGVAPRPIAVNLSPRQFQHKYLVIMVEQILRETGIAPDLLEFELTETLLMSDAEEAAQMLYELKGLGVRLSVDDFGTGYSSLAYLKRFPLDTLKIDRAFIRDAVSDPDDATLTVTIINLAHSMRLKVVAEGVETQGQLNFLRLHGCDEMQGFYFARPLEVNECTQALIEDRRLQKPEVESVAGLPVLLLVDDSDDDLSLLKRALDSDTFRILTAKGTTAGFEMLARHGASIVVSDYQMPGMNGVEFLANVRKLYPHAVRVVVTGAADLPPLTSAVNDAGIHKFLSKHWDSDRLRAEVRLAFEAAPKD